MMEVEREQQNDRRSCKDFLQNGQKRSETVRQISKKKKSTQLKKVHDLKQ